ncbi:esterase-like activity of phytase family protein [Deinococcus lacus]|uniref:Esterase-like activity of phytase family protein n=1 Tax=Deinococcus lacus TaxID=392561 RepID=A0ABW1YE29_9DEIO
MKTPLRRTAALTLALGLSLCTAQAAPATLVGFASQPADTFAGGPQTGAYSGGLRGTPRFPGQPVQGLSGVAFGPGGSWLMLADNGLGSKANSADLLLRVYRMDIKPARASGEQGSVKVLGHINLRDPDRKVPWIIKNDASADRLLTGYDFDPESLAVAPDGTLWIGEEFGPYLLHFSADGKLLEAPLQTPELSALAEKDAAKRTYVRSPQHFSFLTGAPQPGKTSEATIAASGGYEAMALSPSGKTLYPMLERAVLGDSPDLRRLYALDTATREWSFVGYYPVDTANPDMRTGDMTPINEDEYLVIERDDLGGGEAKFKKLFVINVRQKDAQGRLLKRELVDLLNIRDPQGIGAGTQNGRFSFPYVSVEDVMVIDPQTVLVANDNNYPAEGERAPGLKNPSEFIWLRLDTPLNTGAGVGRPNN